MPVTKPDDLDRVYAEAFNAKDLERLLALYEPDAVRVEALSHQQERGREAIREGLEHSLRVRGEMSLQTIFCYEAGDIALLRAKWRVAGTAPDGRPVQLEGVSVEVARRQPNGEWLYVIDHPLGADPKEHPR